MAVIEHRKWVEEHPKALALAVMSDGMITPKMPRLFGKDTIGRIDRVIYRYEYRYLRPELYYKTTDFELTREIANMWLAGVTPVKPRPKKKPAFVTSVATARAVRATILMSRISWDAGRTERMKYLNNTGKHLKSQYRACTIRLLR